MLNPVLDLAQQILFRTRDAPSVGEEVGMEDSMLCTNTIHSTKGGNYGLLA